MPDSQGNRKISLLFGKSISLLSIDKHIGYCLAKVTILDSLHDRLGRSTI